MRRFKTTLTHAIFIELNNHVPQGRVNFQVSGVVGRALPGVI